MDGARAPRRGARGGLSTGPERLSGCRDGLAPSVRDDYRKPARRTGPGGAPCLGAGWRSRADAECPAGVGAGGIARRGGGRRGTCGAGGFRVRGATRAPDGLRRPCGACPVRFGRQGRRTGGEGERQARGAARPARPGRGDRPRMDRRGRGRGAATASSSSSGRLRAGEVAARGVPRDGRGGARRCRRPAAGAGAADIAWRSGILRTSLDQRLAGLARELVAFVEGEAHEIPNALRGAAGSVLGHALSADEPRRTAGVEMALRLAGWLAAKRRGGAGSQRSFGEAARAYRSAGGFLDWARTRLWTEIRRRSLRRRTPAWRGRPTRRASRRTGNSASSWRAGRARDRTTGACWASRRCSTAGSCRSLGSTRCWSWSSTR